MAEYIYGLNIAENKIVNITDIPHTLNGKKCGCICPKCAAPLIAKLGHGGKAPHFAHDFSNNNNCSAEMANESALHRLAKEIINEELTNGQGRITLPPIEVSILELKGIPSYISSDFPEKYEYRKASSIKYTNVFTETTFMGFRPDIIIDSSSGQYLIEIYVTHHPNPDNIEIAKKHGIPMLEIQLDTFYATGANRDVLRDIIITGTSYKTWLVRPDQNKALAWGRNYHLNQPEIKRYLADREKEKRKLERKKKSDARREELFEPQNYKAALKQLHRIGAKHFKDFSFYKDTKSVPFFVDIPITGEMIFKCDRRVWQGAIFDKFIYNRKLDQKGVSIERIISWLKNHQTFIEIDWELATGCDLLSTVLYTYLYYLELCGFLRYSARWDQNYELCKVRSINTHHNLYSESLQTTLSSLSEDDLYSTNINILIRSRFEAAYSKAYDKQNLLKQEEPSISSVSIQESQPLTPKNTKSKDASYPPKDIIDRDFDQNEYTVRDTNGTRWCKCIICHKVFAEQDMSMYGGKNINKGKCKNCMP